MAGTIRTYSDVVRDTMLQRLDEVVSGVCAAFGATCTVTHTVGCPALVNDEAMTSLVIDEAVTFFGDANIYASPSMGAEDMSEFLRRRPGCFFWIGARNERQGIAGRHHDPGFVIDDEALPLGVEFGLRVLESALRDGSQER